MADDEAAEGRAAEEKREQEVLSRAWSAASAYLEPVDHVFLLMMGVVYGRRGAQQWPNGRPPTHEAIYTAHRAALVEVAGHLYAKGAKAWGMLPEEFEPNTAGLVWLWKQFGGWHRSVLQPVIHDHEELTPRQRAIGSLLGHLRQAGMLPRLFDGDMVKEVLKQGALKHRTHELGPSPEKNITADEVISEMVAEDSFRGMIMKRDDRGRPILAPNPAFIFDALVRMRRGEPTPLSLDGSKPGDDGASVVPEPEDPNAEADPSEAASVIETARRVRELRDLCEARSPAALAAFERLYEGKTRRDAGHAHKVSPKQIRLAEEWVRRRASELFDWGQST